MSGIQFKDEILMDQGGRTNLQRSLVAANASTCSSTHACFSFAISYVFGSFLIVHVFCVVISDWFSAIQLSSAVSLRTLIIFVPQHGVTACTLRVCRQNDNATLTEPAELDSVQCHRQGMRRATSSHVTQR